MRPSYVKTLDKVAALLRKRPMTVNELAKALRCCKPIVYQRISDLRARGDVVTETDSPRQIRQGKARPGPRSALYQITEGCASNDKP